MGRSHPQTLLISQATPVVLEIGRSTISRSVHISHVPLSEHWIGGNSYTPRAEWMRFFDAELGDE